MCVLRPHCIPPVPWLHSHPAGHQDNVEDNVGPQHIKWSYDYIDLDDRTTEPSEQQTVQEEDTEDPWWMEPNTDNKPVSNNQPQAVLEVQGREVNADFAVGQQEELLGIDVEGSEDVDRETSDRGQINQTLSTGQPQADLERKEASKDDRSDMNKRGFLAWYDTYFASSDGPTEVSDGQEVVNDNKGDDGDNEEDESEVIKVNDNHVDIRAQDVDINLSQKTAEAKKEKQAQEESSNMKSATEENKGASDDLNNLMPTENTTKAQDGADLDSIEENVDDIEKKIPVVQDIYGAEGGSDGLPKQKIVKEADEEMDSVEENISAEGTKNSILHPIYRAKDGYVGFQRQVVDHRVLQR